MSQKVLLFACVLGVLPMALCAQATHRVIAPSQFTNVEAPGFNGHPALFSFARYQYLYEKVDLLIPKGGRLRAVGFRVDAGGSKLKGSAKTAIFIGETLRTTQNMTATYARNGQVTEYLKERTISLPLVAASKVKPSRSFVMLPLDRPYVYSASKNLLVEYRTTTTTLQAGWYQLDYGITGNRLGVLKSGNYGTGCKNSLNRRATVLPSPGPLGNLSIFFVQGAVPKTLGLFLIGLSDKAWGPIPLPMDLKTFGAPGCQLLTDILMSTPLATDAKGQATLLFRLEETRANNRLRLNGQYVYLDGQGSQARLRTSNGAWMSANVGTRCGLLWSGPGKSFATKGTVHRTYPIVSAFDYN